LREPSIGDWAKGAIALDSTGIISPYKATIAFAENAIQNKAEIALETACLGMEDKSGKIISVQTNRGTIYPKLVINAAGVFSDVIAEMAGDRFFSIHPRKGTEILFDKKTKKYVRSIVARCPLFSAGKTHTKGGAIVSTVDGNVLFGPNAMEIPDRETKETFPGEVDQVYERYLDVIPYFKKSDIIAYFSGIRASTYEEDFIIETGRKTGNLIHVAGIQSPGLTAAPAIARDVAKMAADMLKKTQEVTENLDFNPFRKRIPRLSLIPLEERDRLIKQNPDYGRIICRCEEVSLGEIKDAIFSPLPAQSIDAIKRRVRPGMGRCQGGFCMPHILKLLSEELHIDLTDVNRRGQDTNYGLYKTKDVLFDEKGEPHGNI
jgi:glycerol-3-phosphate dehydrogenase